MVDTLLRLFHDEIDNPKFWVTSVVLGIIISIAANLLTSFLRRSWEWLIALTLMGTMFAGVMGGAGIAKGLGNHDTNVALVKAGTAAFIVWGERSNTPSAERNAT
jgi:hypothetical protein